MALNRQRCEEGSVEDYGSGANTNSTDELAALKRDSVRSGVARGVSGSSGCGQKTYPNKADVAVSCNLTWKCVDLLWKNVSEREGTGEMMVIRTLQRLIGPIFVPIFRPLIRQFVKHEIELAKQELLISMKENPESKATTSVLKKLKLQFRNKIALPVFTGMPLLGENKKPIEIALVDALSGEIVISAAKLEILGFRVGDDDHGSWTYEDLQERILSARNGRRILQGDTHLQLKEGVGFVHKISFTHNSTHTRNDREKHPCPSLSDKVLHLQKISHNGARYSRLKKAKVYTVNDLLRLLYTDPKRLEEILELKASCKCWDAIVKNAQASSGMFLYLDPRNEHKTGVVLDAKLQLKAVIVEPHLYTAVNQLSEQQKFASEHFNMLRPFEHESSLKEHLQPGASLPSVRITDGPPRLSSQVTKSSHGLTNSNHKPFVTTQSERGKEKVPFDDEMINSTNDYQEYVPNGLNFGTATESGTSSRAVESFLDIFDINGPMLSESQLFSLLKDTVDFLNESPNECQSNPATVSFCAIARERWTKVSKLLRRNSVRERISLSQAIEPLKKQRNMYVVWVIDALAFVNTVVESQILY
ncbi:hypothetical protein L1987_47387 [Smallanthus sonchifolius]|uniref:Uncharacterized protein n=1 Tax=Smallanthus sonchifolius TaxID=185202 RepID=A0ACB9G289_9ASTR|nr:hypothetical protein L1987_47387 [Smallanthus sonchifolius]